MDSQEDRAVLALLYSATDGENWKANSNWLSDRPIREWHGVTSDAEGRVTGLYLSDNQLSGSIPPETGDLSQLQWLYLQKNELTGQVPRSFFNLANLISFYFSDNPGLCAPVDKEFQTWLQGKEGADGAACNPVADLNALTRLYNATDGVNWYRNSNWLSDRPIREWHGVETDDEGHVTVLDLRWNDLNGTIPPELGGLSSLKELDLAGNQLTGTIPPELGSLDNLEELDLWMNELTGTIPRKLGSLDNMTSLWLTDNLLTGEIPPVLGDLSNLENLGLSDNMLTGEIPPVLGDLSNLDYLGLGDNQLSGTIPTQLGSLTNLTWLRLWNNQLTGTIPRSFTGLTNLTRFEFWDNAGLCAPTDEVFRAWLRGIDIYYGVACDFVPDRDVLGVLYNDTDGDNWEDSSNWLTDQPMGDWYGVGTDYTGRVTSLSLEGNQLTGAIPGQLGNLSNLTLLDLDDNQLAGAIPDELGNLSNLRWLDLRGNQLTGTIPTQLGNLSNLWRLYLDDNQLTGTIPTQLGNLSNLTSLSLRDNQLTGTIPDELGNLTKLTWVRLDGNQLTGTIPAQLGNLTDLTVLALHDNQLTGEFPDSLTRLTQLYAFSYHGNIGLCAPVNDSFQTWLQGIGTVLGSSCAPVDSQADRGVLVKLYDAADGANWENNSNWLSDRPIREWYGVTNDADGRVIGLYLGENGLSGSMPPELGNLSNLQRLRLNSNQLTGEIPPKLGSLSSLVELYLSDNQLTGSIPPELGNLSSLEWLHLSDNQLTGSIPPELGNLSNLIGLYLSGNQFTGCIPASLQYHSFFNDLRRLGLPTCGIPAVTMSVDSATYQVRIGSPVPVTATFSESVNGFTAGDLTVANGSVSNFVGSDGDSAYTFDVIPNAIGVVTVDVAAGIAESNDGNGNTAAVQLILGLPYDDDGNGAIGPSEILEAARDYFSGTLSAQHVLELIGLYFQSPG